MLPSLILNLFAFFGKGLVSLCYKREGMNACKTLEKDLNAISTLWGLGLMFWLLSTPLAISSIIEDEAFPFAIVYTILYPVVYLIWFFAARKNVADLIYDAKVYTEKKNAEEV